LTGLCLYVFSSKVQKYRQKNKQKIYTKTRLKQTGVPQMRKRRQKWKQWAADPICKAFLTVG
jgi:hypothetical protein